MIKFLVAAISLIAFSFPAQARHHHRYHHHYRNIDQTPVIASQHEHQKPLRSPRVRYSRHTHRRIASGFNGAFLSHPAGCPRIAFCGCGAAVEVFGAAKRSLWLAAAWFHFPHTSPAPGMVAVRPHHVFVLRQHIEGSVWLVADFNSGGHQSRLHARSVAGYTIVNPHATRYASM